MAAYDEDAEVQRITAANEKRMVLLADLERPILLGSPLAAVLLKPRPSPPVPPPASKKAAFKLTTPLSPRSKEQLQIAYWKHVASPVPHMFGGHGQELYHDGITTVIPGRAWVVPQLLSEEECVELICLGEEFGLEPALAATGARYLCTNKRTSSYCNLELAAAVAKRLPDSLLEVVEETKPHTCVRGVHPNWRIARYDSGDFFAAHYDQADSLTFQGEEG